MAKKIPEKIKKAWASFCKERLVIDSEGMADEDADGSFSIECLDFLGDTEKWEFHASNHNPNDTYDFYELFWSAKGYCVEEHGYDDFYVVLDDD